MSSYKNYNKYRITPIDVIKDEFKDFNFDIFTDKEKQLLEKSNVISWQIADENPIYNCCDGQFNNGSCCGIKSYELQVLTIHFQCKDKYKVIITLTPDSKYIDKKFIKFSHEDDPEIDCELEL